VNMENQKLIERVNEIYHDLTADDYNSKTHCDMLKKEESRWRKAWGYVGKKRINILDIGTGAGFVPLSIGGKLREKDLFVCSDISGKILDVAKNNIENAGIRCRFAYVRSESLREIRDECFDVVTINSTLHHIPDTANFLAEIDRILKVGGLLIIGHEPNRRFSKNIMIQFYYFCLRLVFSPVDVSKDMLRLLKIDGVVDEIVCLLSKRRREIIHKRRKVADKINEKLKEEGLIERDLRHSEIMKIVDFLDKGFIPEEIVPHYKTIWFETYDHLRDLGRSSSELVDANAEYLKNRYPKDGRTFFLVAQKVEING
jgi:ubiquinone/menaquinone biosynthesis C-methylase UbiE